VILAWDDVLRGVEDPDDGHNVVLQDPELFAELQRYYRQDPSLRARSDPQPPT
jgi:Mlc titration factor MtfA (ptsG expression regulator)